MKTSISMRAAPLRRRGGKTELIKKICKELGIGYVEGQKSFGRKQLEIILMKIILRSNGTNENPID